MPMFKLFSGVSRAELDALNARLDRLEMDRVAFVTEVTSLVDKLTTLENRQRARQQRAEQKAEQNGAPLNDYREGRMRGWK